MPIENGESGGTSYGVDVGSADTASFDLDVDVAVLEFLWLDLSHGSSSMDSTVRKAYRVLTSSFLKSLQSFWEWIMNPSKVSG